MTLAYISRSGKPDIAYRYTPPTVQAIDKPIVMFLGGYRSDMDGTKATHLERFCQDNGQGYLRFDYSGHGLSGGSFEEGTMGSWKEDALAVLDHVGAREVLLVGSSMGGWLALLVALERKKFVSGLIGIAAAPDFTEALYETRLNEAQKEQLAREGFVLVPNDYSDKPYLFTQKFREEARDNFVLDKKHHFEFPLHLIQGREDKDVPWQTTDKIQAAFEGSEITVTFIEDGGHSLSRPQDLRAIERAISEMM